MLREPDGALRDNITIPQGGRWSRTWTITDDDGNPLDVTGWRVRSQIRYSARDPVLFEWNSQPGTGLGTAGVTGTTAWVRLTGAESAAWSWVSAARYDVYLFDPTGTPSRIVFGDVALTAAITH